MADRFLQNRNATDDSSRKAMDAMAEGLRGDLGQVTAAHAGLYRQLSEQNEKLDVISADARSARSAAEALEFRLNSAEARLQRLGLLMSIALALLLVAVGLLIALLLRPH